MGHKGGVDHFTDAIPRMTEKAGNVLFVLYALEGFVDEEQLKDMVGANGAKGMGQILGNIKECAARATGENFSCLKRGDFREDKAMGGRHYYKLSERLRPTVYHTVIKSFQGPCGPKGPEGPLDHHKP